MDDSVGFELAELEPNENTPHVTEFVIERVEGELMAVNSFLVHGPEGVVVVDGRLTVSDAAKVRAAVSASGRTLAGVLITIRTPTTLPERH